MLEVRDMTVAVPNGKALLRAVSFSLEPGRILGLTGPSGAGKTTLLKGILGMLDAPCLSQGEVKVNGRELGGLSPRGRREICGTGLGFIPQNPMTAFDSRLTIGKQMVETFRVRLKLSKAGAAAWAGEMLREVNLKDTLRIMNSYPAQISGGMLQRVAMALLIGLKPDYILADEPTSALDEVNRDIILELLGQQRNSAGILMISHDVGAMGRLCDEVMVLEKGSVLERGTMGRLLAAPRGEWTRAFAAACRAPDRSLWKWRDWHGGNCG
ncbi:ABC transporter ATP-binding protein [Desulfitobacterium chlororespirans]|uniref:Peptide/nickel transport system ATP-binding protein n=1 Tax=Desulfitobacterium chlororespirans DSM 11544 TaxID=1121395 RepID=A0A1M7SK04_9FIRM|nr:ABC transporter ATP-binding protein [Desulfitobacterium chlororespirans]SHN58793.1 peptide/nickel transport system ATP-binding protein [Desulfitobacterium chlororespirans DSM 11544]